MDSAEMKERTKQFALRILTEANELTAIFTVGVRSAKQSRNRESS